MLLEWETTSTEVSKLLRHVARMWPPCHGGGWSSGKGRDLEEKKNIAKGRVGDGWNGGASEDDDLSIR